MIRVVLALTAALAALSGCGGASGDGDATRAHSVPEHGFSLALPSDWETLKPDEALTSNEIEKFSEANPEIRQYVEALATSDSPIKFLAFDPDRREDFVTNLNIVVLPLAAGVGFEEWATAAAAEIDKLPTRSSSVAEKRVSLPAGEALFLEYEQEINLRESVRAISTRQYGFVARGRAYVLTFTAVPEQLEWHGGLFHSVAESFRLTE